MRLRKLARGEVPKIPTTRTSERENGSPQEEKQGNDQWEVQEVARRKWEGPKNDFGHIAFDDAGVWFLPHGAPLIRVPLPKE